MQFNTKYNFKDKVYPIYKCIKNISKPCSLCEGLGSVFITKGNRKVICPDCLGNKKTIEVLPQVWRVQTIRYGQIGKIIIEKYYNEKQEVKYMLDSTGIGCGTIWLENQLFLTLEEAQKECDTRNSRGD